MNREQYQADVERAINERIGYLNSQIDMLSFSSKYRDRVKRDNIKEERNGLTEFIGLVHNQNLSQSEAWGY
ncbi:hypothetical protein HYT24_00030 [Candidatus Pacearchaeota archaeon]|nr:hypothetical protein [Candidatus Pacearchaeota archaeon]